MENQWFESMILEWTPDISWDPTAISKATELISEISTINGGEIIEDVSIEDADRKNFAIQRAKEGIQRYLNQVAQPGNSYISNRYYKDEIDIDEEVLRFLTPKKLMPKVDINLATWEELEDLPGIGKITATRIIKYREEISPFSDIEDTKKVKGISKQAFDSFKSMVYIANKNERRSNSYHFLDLFNKDPSFINYIHLHQTEDKNIIEIILEVLKTIRYEIGLEKYPPLKLLPQTRSSKVIDDITRITNVDMLKNRTPANDVYGRLIFDNQYGPFMEYLLSECKSSLHIVMFFFRFEDKDSYPTDTLMQKIIDAKARGANIKIILDIDEADDAYNSNQINNNAYNFLIENGIEVSYDSPESVTHSKLIIMDSRHVIIGSHNWTAGSLYQYDDTSVYIDSTELAKDYELEFERRWIVLNNY